MELCHSSLCSITQATSNKSHVSQLSLGWQSSTVSFYNDELLSHGSDMWEWYFSKHVLHLPILRCFSVYLTLESFVWAPSFCPRLATILSQHNSAVPAQAGDAQSDLEMMGLDEKHNICFDRDFTFCSVQQYMSNVLGSQPRDFPSFLWDGAGNEY